MSRAFPAHDRADDALTSGTRRGAQGAGTRRLAAASGMLVAVSAFATPTAWSPSAEQRASLAAGEVVIDARIDESRQRGEVRAAVRIDAPPARVYAAMTDCRTALGIVPGLERCVVLESNAEEAWEIIEHEVDLGWWAPRVQYSFRAEYEHGRSVAFTHVAGDLRENEGRWGLEPVDDGRATVVTYGVRLVPGTPVPGWLVRASLRNRLPALLEALRAHAEAAAP